MAYDQRSLDDYVDVAERIQEFRAAFPQGTLRGDWRMIQVGDQHLVAYRAEAFRGPEDAAPGVGCAWELVPGRTPYTRGSELQNAETSAWGRAIIAVGAADAKRGIASRQEVQLARERNDGLPVNRDGSLSRSRTTDEEKAAAGVMTDAQNREHNALERDVKGTGPQGTGRLPATPADDPFYDPFYERPKPAGWVLSEAFARVGVFGRAERLARCSAIAGREVASSSELSAGEVTAVLLELAAEPAAEKKDEGAGDGAE